MNILGVIGGMGVQATGCFYEMLTAMQTVKHEQDYLDVLIYSKPSIPDRTAFITGQSAVSPLEPLLHAAGVLEKAGATCIAMPCVTGHYFYNELVQVVKVPILNMLEETARYAANHGYKKVGLLATDGTVQGRFFHDAFAAYGIETIVPDAAGQTAVMDLIYAIKCGASRDAGYGLDTAIDNLYSSGAQAVVLGCTELSRGRACPSRSCPPRSCPPHIDAMEILARAALSFNHEKH